MKKLAEVKEIFESVKDSQNKAELTEAHNKMVDIRHAHSLEIGKKVESEDFADVDGVDFNEWAYDQNYEIDELIIETMNLISALNWEQNGFNVY